MKRYKTTKKGSTGLYALILFVGAPIYLIMEHPVILWCIFIPLAITFIYNLFKFLSNPASGIRNFLTAMFILVMMIVALVIVGLV